MSAKKKKVLAAWIVVFIAFLGGVALANVQNKVPPIIDVMMVYFNIGETEAGWLTSIFTLMGIITAIPAAWLMRKLGTKRIGALSLSCAALGSLIGAFASDIALLMFSRVIEGIGVGIIAVVGPALIAMWFPPEKRGLPMGLWGSWMMVSQTVLFFIAGGVTLAFGWQGIWWFTFIFCVIVLILYMWKVDAPPEGTPNYSEGEDEGSFKFRDAFTCASSWVMALIGVIFTFCCFGFVTYISLYWAGAFFDGDMNQSNWWISIMYAIEIPVVIFIGWILNHVRLERRKFVGAIGFFLYAAILFYCFRMDAIGLLLPFILIYPFLEGSIPTVYWTLTPSTAKSPEHAPAALGIMNVGLNIGTLLGPPVIGWIIENIGWAEATIPLAVASLIGAVLFCFIKTYDKKTEAVTEK